MSSSQASRKKNADNIFIFVVVLFWRSCLKQGLIWLPVEPLEVLVKWHLPLFVLQKKKSLLPSIIRHAAYRTWMENYTKTTLCLSQKTR